MRRVLLLSGLMGAVAVPVMAQGIINRDTGGVTTTNTGGVVMPDSGGVSQRDTGGVKTVLPSIQADRATDGPSAAAVGQKAVVKTVSSTRTEHRGKRASHGW